MTYDILRSQLNPLTFPLLNAKTSEIVFRNALSFLQDSMHSYEQKNEIFFRMSLYFPLYLDNSNNLINFKEYFVNNSDFLIINLLKNKDKAYFISENEAIFLFNNYQFHQPVLSLFDSSLYQSTQVLLKNQSSISLWDWLFKQTQGVFFTGKLKQSESKDCLYRFIYNNFYFNNDPIDKMLMLLSVMDIIIKNQLVNNNDNYNDLYSLCQLYFNEGYGYFSHLNDNFIINKYTIPEKQQIIYSEFLSLIYYDFNNLFQANSFLITPELAQHILKINIKPDLHSDLLQNHLISYREKILLSKIISNESSLTYKKQQKRI